MPSSTTMRSPTALDLVHTMMSSTAPQLSEEWFAIRRDRLTASKFSTALGFWKGGKCRADLWRQKVFASDSDHGVGPTSGARAAMDWGVDRTAMDWGVHNEARAIENYKRITSLDVGCMGLSTHVDEALGWLGASPDGLLDPGPGYGRGILEIKCPYNNGRPEMGRPWLAMPDYYMPQVQGMMEIMDRDWTDFYCWTLNGSTLFRVVRDRDYWHLMLEVLHEFWWGCVVPAREALRIGRVDIAKRYEPAPEHRLTEVVMDRSMRLAAEARLICREVDGHVEWYM